MSSSARDILNLFLRPGEPVCLPKGDDKVIFIVDPKYLPERYRPAPGQKLRPDFAVTQACTCITVKKLNYLPDLTIPCELGLDEPFSLFIPHHSMMAGKLIDIFLEMKSYDELLAIAVYCRNRVNSLMFIYALSVTLMHNEHTKSFLLPSLVEVFPFIFMNRNACKNVTKEASVFETKSRQTIEIKPEHTASEREEEHRVAYFREDLGINLHHWHWHLVYPDNTSMDMVNKDRRGELFYYMHQQIIARYNFERLSNNLGLVKSFVNWEEPIPEGYFSKLGIDMGTGSFPGRHSGATVKDVDRNTKTPGKINIKKMMEYKDRIIKAIDDGFVIGSDDKPIKLDEFEGIDILGNIVEASLLSKNREFYGNLHNNGHVMFAACHDPDYRHLEDFGVMGQNATAMRDPIFYRWHKFIDDLYQRHKSSLPPYTVDKLDFEGIKIDDVRIIIDKKPSNSFVTFWDKSEVDISGGLDFTPGGAMWVRFTHLNHKSFSYKITATNDSKVDKPGTVRIFMAPKNDDHGNTLLLEEQRHMMIEMDKFIFNLCPGPNVIEHESNLSSVTIPFERTFHKADRKTQVEKPVESAEFNYCGCGWPQHMLIPKGTKEGLPVDLFVMISDSDVDKVDQNVKTCCKDAVSYCGLKDKKYPDTRAMGYPFDRRPRDGISNLKQFLTGNMHVVKMNIVFDEKQALIPSTSRLI